MPSCARDDGQQLGPLRVRGQEAQRRVRIEHLVLGRPDAFDLEEVVHHSDPVEARLVGRPGDGRESWTELFGSARPRKVRYLKSEFHCSNPRE
jgi:hypothetical protein